MANNRYFHSVRLKEDQCKGCTHCIRTCPTEAIRVHDGKAIISEERCIDCGECIRTCPHNAKYVYTDPVDMIKDYRYRVALPAPSFMAQFDQEKIGIDKVYNALNLIGFQYIYEVASAAAIVNVVTEKYLETSKKPLISSACPAVVRLILTKFPEYLEYVAMIEPPMDVAAKISKDIISKKLGIPSGEIGAFFITPCPAKVTAVKQPEAKDSSLVDGVLSMKEIYDLVMQKTKEIKEVKHYKHADRAGIIWGVHEGEIEALETQRKVAISGIHNVISFLENIDQKEFKRYDFIEAQACIPGCVGGVLAPTDKFAAKIRLKQLSDYIEKEDINPDKIIEEYGMKFFLVEKQLMPRNIDKLDLDIERAMEKAEQIEALAEEFPGIDCGACGCPTCRALAEDIVQNKATKYDCIFILREKFKEMNKEFDLLNKNRNIK